MPDLAALVTPPLLLDSTGAPANGDIYARLTNNVTIGAGIATPTQVQGKVINGQFKSLSGAAFYIPVTPEGVGVELFVELIEGRPYGYGSSRDRHSIRRTVSVPDVATVTWDALIDLIAVDAGPEVVIPDWVATTLTASTAAVTAAATATGAKVDAEAAAASVAPGVAGGTATLDGSAKVPEAQIPDRLSAGELSDTIAAEAVPRGALSLIADIAAANFTAELQARIDEVATAGGGIVEIGKGTAAVTATIKLKAGVSIRGRGKTATALTSNGDWPMFQSNTPLTRIDNVELAALRLYRVVPAAAATAIIDWTGISHSELRDLSLDQPSSSRHSTIGVLFGATSYYNKIDMVQVRGVNEGLKFQAEANANNITNCTVLTSNYGYVADNTNSLAFIGSAAEHVDAVGFLFRNGSKKNRVVASRAEDVPTCFQVLSSGTPSFDNFFIANLAYERASGTRYDLQTSNVLIEESTARFLVAHTSRTYVRAVKNASQAALPAGTWTKVTYETEIADQINEFASSTLTVALAGLYQLEASTWWAAGVAGTHLELGLYKNGVLASKVSDIWVGNTSAHETAGSTVLKLAAGDTIEVYAKTSAALGISSGANDTFFTATRIA